MNDGDAAAGRHGGAGRGADKSEVARDYGVSRRWVITLIQRYLAEGDPGLEPRSRWPVRGPSRTADELEDEIVAIRKDLDRHGHHRRPPAAPARLQPGGLHSNASTRH